MFLAVKVKKHIFQDFLKKKQLILWQSLYILNQHSCDNLYIYTHNLTYITHGSSCCRTSMVVCIDDPKMTDQLAEFLLQVQGGFSQGSIKGIVAPKSSILLTSNSKETDRFVIIASRKKSSS